MVIAYIGVGSNLGDREAYIRSAGSLLDDYNSIKLTGTSKVYETDPWGYEDQGKFLNCVFEIETSLSPSDLLARLMAVERELGRERTIPNGPRTIDLDILFYDHIVLSAQDLSIPHPRLHERKFVLQPLCDLAPEFIHPVIGERCDVLLKKLGG